MRWPLALALLPATANAAAADLDTVRLRSLLRHDCGACHGLTLQGGLGPPLTAAALDGKPASLLVDTILDGRPGTPMPGWRGLLNAEEARWIVTVLKRAPDADEDE
ncbi:MAG: cytochrome c [Gammaproteobacteria bacterium]|nr:cytochrome c [Gammaproteobacteria bacterium]